MAITITAPCLKSTEFSSIPLSISVSADSGAVDSLTVSGLPSDASVAPATQTAAGSWTIPFGNLTTARIKLASRPPKALSLALVAAGTDANGASQSANATWLLEIAEVGAENGGSKVGLAIALVVFNIALFICWRQLYERAQFTLTKDWSVDWQQPAGLMLQPGPITFWYDSSGKQLHHRGPIDNGLKAELIKLAHVASEPSAGPLTGKERGGSDTTEDPKLLDFANAISKLAFLSNSLIDSYFIYLLSIAGLSGMIGTQIRAFANFIYISTQTNKLDVRTWWPWYALRPILGFLLGLTVVLLVQAKLFVPTSDSPPSGTAWWMALAMLVGFGADDFSQRLRLVAQALFGKDK